MSVLVPAPVPKLWHWALYRSIPVPEMAPTHRYQYQQVLVPVPVNSFNLLFKLNTGEVENKIFEIMTLITVMERLNKNTNLNFMLWGAINFII